MELIPLYYVYTYADLYVWVSVFYFLLILLFTFSANKPYVIFIPLNYYTLQLSIRKRIRLFFVSSDFKLTIWNILTQLFHSAFQFVFYYYFVFPFRHYLLFSSSCYDCFITVCAKNFHYKKSLLKYLALIHVLFLLLHKGFFRKGMMVLWNCSICYSPPCCSILS